MDNRSNDKKQNRSGFSGGRSSGGNRRGGTSPRAGFDRKGAGKRFARPAEKAGRPSEERRNERATPARTAALTALSDVLDRGAYVSEAINRQLSQSTFPQNDRKFCTALVYGTLENLTAIDYILKAFIEDAEKLDGQALHILRLAVCQKAFMDKIPDNAIADEAVKLTRQIGLEHLTGFVNGVLRNYIREPEKAAFPSEEEDPVRYLSIRYSMPEWIVNQLIEDYGAELA